MLEAWVEDSEGDYEEGARAGRGAALKFLI